MKLCEGFVTSGQNEALGPTSHLLCRGCFPQSHHLRLIHKMCSTFRIRCQKRQ